MALYDLALLGSGLEFDAVTASPCAFDKVPGKDWVCAIWYRSTSEVYAQVFSVDTTTGAIAALGSPIDLEGGTAAERGGLNIFAIDSSNAVVAWSSVSTNLKTQLLSINGSGSLSTNGSATTITTSGRFPSMMLWDSTHIICGWRSSGVKVQMATLNTGAGTITAAGSPLQLPQATGSARDVSFAKLSSSKCLIAYAGDNSTVPSWVCTVSIDGSYNVTNITNAYFSPASNINA